MLNIINRVFHGETLVVAFKHNKPKEVGYYFALYEHTSGKDFWKPLWWDGEKFLWDNLKYVKLYVNVRHDHIIECQKHGLEIAGEYYEDFR